MVLPFFNNLQDQAVRRFLLFEALLNASQKIFGAFIGNLESISNLLKRSLFFHLAIVHHPADKLKIISFLDKRMMVKFFKVPHIFNRIAYTFFRGSKAKRSYDNSMKILDFVPKPIGYIEYKKFGLLYTIPGLIILYVMFNIPLAVWLLQGFFKEVPEEIIEAARIDGCTPRQELFRISIPLAGTGLISVGILTFIFIWNEFIFASILTNEASRTLPVWAAYTTFQHYIINFAMLGISSTVMIVPVIIFAILMQRYLVRGLSLGALKE